MLRSQRQVGSLPPPGRGALALYLASMLSMTYFIEALHQTYKQSAFLLRST